MVDVGGCAVVGQVSKDHPPASDIVSI